MKLYRLSTIPYARLLDGLGASIRGGHWNPLRVPMISTAAEPALAVLEVLAHCDLLGDHERVALTKHLHLPLALRLHFPARGERETGPVLHQRISGLADVDLSDLT